MYVYKAKVISVYDGDTCRVDIDLGFNFWARNQPIRWSEIDAPELKGSERTLGLIARDVVRDKILEQEVVIKTYKAGKYGRWLGTFWTMESWNNGCRDFKDSINQWLLDNGYAKQYGE